MQILNNDRKPLIKLGPLGAAGLGSQSVRSFALIMSHSPYSQPSPRINISSGTLIIFNHPAEMKARVIDTASICSTWGSFPFLSPPLTALTDKVKERRGEGGALSTYQEESS